MDHFDKDLQELVAKGKSQGYLTYDEVTEYLPDEAVDPDKLDNLLISLDELGIELVSEVPEAEFFEPADGDSGAEAEPQEPLPPGQVPVEGQFKLSGPIDVPKWSNDPIRLYLSPMAEIPLLSREEEISLAKKIEVTRKRFRRSVVGCNIGMRATVKTLTKVHKGILPFDRTVKVSLTERLTKQQILGRMPYHLTTLAALNEANTRDFACLINSGLAPRTERPRESVSSVVAASRSRWSRN